MDDWLELIGLSFSECTPVLRDHGIDLPNAEHITSTSNTKTYDFYTKGISFYFINDQLNTIDFFLISKKFQPTEYPLPFGITAQDTGLSLVEKFGEPVEKGGGKVRFNVWLRWENLQVELDDWDWDKLKLANCVCVMIFKD